MKKTNGLDREYWYTAQDIVTMLTEADNFRVYDPIDTHEREQTVQAINGAVTHLQEAPNNTIAIPINIGNRHWSALVLRSRDGTTEAHYNDPLGHEIPEQLNRILLNNDIETLNIHDYRVTQQNNGYDCGPWAVYNLRDMVEGIEPFNPRSPHNAREDIDRHNIINQRSDLLTRTGQGAYGTEATASTQVADSIQNSLRNIYQPAQYSRIAQNSPAQSIQSKSQISEPNTTSSTKSKFDSSDSDKKEQALGRSKKAKTQSSAVLIKNDDSSVTDKITSSAQNNRGGEEPEPYRTRNYRKLTGTEPDPMLDDPTKPGLDLAKALRQAQRASTRTPIELSEQDITNGIKVKIVTEDGDEHKASEDFTGIAIHIGPGVKAQMPQYLEEGPASKGRVLGCFYTKSNRENSSGTSSRHNASFFAVIGGGDAAVVPLIEKDAELDGTRVMRRNGNPKTFKALAAEMDGLVDQRVSSNQVFLEGDNTEKFRMQIGQDIINIASGENINNEVSLQQMGALSEFSAVIRCDKGRGALKINQEWVYAANPYIDHVLKSGNLSFEERFGGDEPRYIGTSNKVNPTTIEKIRENPKKYLIPDQLSKHLPDDNPLYNSGPQRLKFIGEAILVCPHGDRTEAFPRLGERSEATFFESDTSSYRGSSPSSTQSDSGGERSSSNPSTSLGSTSNMAASISSTSNSNAHPNRPNNFRTSSPLLTMLAGAQEFSRTNDSSASVGSVAKTLSQNSSSPSLNGSPSQTPTALPLSRSSSNEQT